MLRNLTTHWAMMAIDENDNDDSDHDDDHYDDGGSDDLRFSFCFLATMATTHSHAVPMFRDL